ncbi:hypothetical protein C206_22906 [Pseudomonas putida TRO1]|jgi:uncharacterized membrane protein YcfT|uniref:Uncharacterized protein n=2 Tax=Pseudomonas TaxID=286 RepID=A0AAD2ZR92_PSEPU|nr:MULTISPECIES: hypothetical protein [Pseudomonas]ANI35448.1 hypothetical protein AA098_18855 [Pseudomonas sp. JY-Q]ELS0922715.1 hypothetical protein [Pseudomonas putida]ENY75302.1 hypothetical protein C206_22906 [Pseudomonas putida TRO1]MDF3929313.1 hypothetical protein [Pseudomonas putida]MDH1694456.1 hypothetical protein [Pseudomonas sp. GD03766]
MPERPVLDSLTSALVAFLGVDGDVLFAALLGALLVSAARDRLITNETRRLTLAKKLLLVFVTVGVGHLFEPLVSSLVPLLTRGMSAFVAAVVVIPISLKVMVWLDTLDPRELIQRWRRRG